MMGKTLAKIVIKSAISSSVGTFHARISMNKIEQASNSKVKITTLLDQTTTGTIFAIASNQQLIVLKVKSTKNGELTYKFINSAFIKSIQVLPPFPTKKNGYNSLKNQPTLHYISIEELDRLLNKALKAKPVKVSNPQPRQKLVSSRIQRQLAEAFGKTNVRWDNDKIIVKEKIKVSHPFTLGKNNIVPLVPSAKEDLSKVLAVVKEFWLTLDNEKKGG